MRSAITEGNIFQTMENKIRFFLKKNRKIERKRKKKKKIEKNTKWNIFFGKNKPNSEKYHINKTNYV